MKRFFLRLPPEWVVTGFLLLVAIAFSRMIHAPFQFPSTGAFLFVGITYLMPFILISVWVLLPLPFLIYRGELKKACLIVVRQAGFALCLGAVMLLHFHIKLWIPLINPRSYDPVYETVDRICFFWLDPLIRWRGELHSAFVDHLYFNLFMFMFVCSFIVHHLYGRREFRTVFLASVLVQAFGAVCYLIAPAVGPFIYHDGANAHVTITQHGLLLLHQDLIAGGIDWLRGHTSQSLAAGLAAMPSLHIAASFVFLYYAQRYGRWMTWFYWPFFLWIVFEAMASRWHYGIDLVAGFALSCVSIYLANIWMEARQIVINDSE